MTTTSKLVKPGTLYEVGPDGRWNFFFDSSMIRNFTDCEAYFELKHVRNIGTRGRAWKRDVGSWWSATLELYYNAMRAGDLTLSKAIEFALHAWEELNMDEFAVSHPSSYADFGGRKGAAVMIGEYFQWAAPLDSTYWKVVSVEEGAGRLREVNVGENRQVTVYYIVKPDLFVLEQDVLVPVDHKTKDYIKPRLIHDYKPHQQTQGYIVAAQELANALGIKTTVDRCLLNVAARNQPGPRAKQQERFARYPVYYSQYELAEWRKRTVATATRLRYCIENDEWLWNDSACHKYSGCVYRPIHSAAPNSRELVIKASYVQLEPWTPYKTDDEEGE
jgi:hypothetical protein